MKKQFRRVTAVLLAALCTVPVFWTKGMADDVGKFKSEKLNSKKFMEAYSLGTPIEQVQTNHCVTGMEDGYNMLYTTSAGTPAVFNVFNMDTKKLERTFKLTGCSSVWTHAVDQNGNVYMASQDKAFLFRYSPETKELENLGSIMGQTACYDLNVDEKGNVYVGVFPMGTVIKYDIETKTFSAYDPPKADNKYIRSLGYYNGSLYAGTFGNGGELYRIDTKTGKSEKVEIPQREGYTTFSDLYEMTTVGKYLFIYANRVEGTDPVMLIYDCEKKQFCEDYALKSMAYFVSPEYNGKTYFSAGGYLQEFDLETGKLNQTDMKFNLSQRGSGWMDLKEEGYTGKTLVTITYSGVPFLFNLEARKFRNMDEAQLSGSGVQIHNITSNTDFNKIFMSGYVAAKGSVYDPETNALTPFALGQAENMCGNENYMYFGVYPGGHVYRMGNPKQGEVPAAEKVFTIGEDQDRPYNVMTADGKVFFGTIPNYGKLGGALTIYDEATNTKEVYRNVVKDHSIVGLAYKDGKIYGSTCITPGLGIDPVAKEATMFVFDVEKKQVIKEFTPNFPKDKVPSGKVQIGDLELGPDGLIWGAVRSYLFALDPDTLEIKKEVLLKPFQWGSGQYWRPIFLRFASDGTLYVSGEGIHVVDIDTLEYINLKEYSGLSGELLALDKDDNVYTADGSQLIKITAVKDPIPDAERPAVDELLKKAVTLKVGSSMAVANGTPKRIDPENSSVAPEVVDGRTLVPVRFISENMGGTVGWEEETQTVTIQIEGKNIAMKIGSTEMTVDGKAIALDVPAQTIDDRTMLPLRALCEQGLGREVYWNDSGLIVTGNGVSGIDDNLAANLNRYFTSYLGYDYKMEQDRIKREEKEKEEQKIAKYLLPIQNPSFEMGGLGDEVPKWKNIYDVTKETWYEVTDRKANQGKQSLYIEDSSESIGMALESYPVEVTPGKKFTAKTDLFIAEGRTSFLVKFYDSRMNVIYEEPVHVQSGVGSWQEIEITTKVPDNAIIARVLCSCSNLWTTKAYYDNIRVYQYDNELK